MAILNGIISKLCGSAGNLTFKRNGGQTVVSEKLSALSWQFLERYSPTEPIAMFHSE